MNLLAVININIDRTLDVTGGNSLNILRIRYPDYVLVF